MAETTEFVASAKVAGIVTDKQVAFNLGSDAGVQMNDIVMLFRAVEIVDPDTSERLGGVEIPRLRLKVTLLSKKFCVATVVDREMGSELFSVTSVRRTKRVTDDPAEESENDVLVTIGEKSSIRRVAEESEGDSSPF